MTAWGIFAPVFFALWGKNKDTFKDENVEIVEVAGWFQRFIVVTYVISLLSLLLTVWAIYLSFARNRGFDLASFLVALCCSLCYIAYAYAVPVNQ